MQIVNATTTTTTKSSNTTTTHSAKFVVEKFKMSPSPTATVVHRRQWLTSQRHLLLLTTLGFCLLAFLLSPSSAFEAVSDKNLEEPTKYSDWTKNATYQSSSEYNARGMQPLYDITQHIMRFFIGSNPLPDGYLELKNGEVHYGPKTKNNEWGDLIKHYWLVLLTVVLVGILIIVMPIIGFCFCCCRCAGACGGRSEPFDKEHDTCRRVCYGILLILLATGILFGVICAFATNTYIQYGITGSTSAARTASNDTQTFLTTTGEQLDWILVKNYNELSAQLKKNLDDTSQFIITQLEEKSMAVSMIYLTDFLTKLPDVRDKLEKMKTITNELRVSAQQLSDGLRGVKRDLLVMLTKCNTQSCKDVLTKYEIGKLGADGIHYDQLPDVTEIIAHLDTLINDNIVSAGDRGRASLEAMRKHLRDQIATSTPQIVEALNKAGLRLQTSSNQIQTELRKISSVVGNYTNKYTGIADNVLDEYNPYRYYFGIAVCTLLLLILLCLVIALLCGICGKRPDGYGDDCCNKGAGSRFLMIAVALIFLTISGILLTALIHFLLGTVLYRGVCVPFRDPHNDEMFAKLDNSIDLNEVLYPSSVKVRPTSGFLPPLRISHVITNCQANKTIYEVLHLQNRLDVHDIHENPSVLKINETLENLVQNIDFQTSDIQILSADDKQRILELGNSVLKNFDSGRFIDNLRDAITKHSLTEIAQQLRITAKQITSNEMKNVQVSLRNQALHLETYEQNLVIPMKQHSAEMMKLASDLDRVMRYKNRPFEEAIPLLVNEIESSQLFIQEEGRPFVKAAAQNLTSYFSSEIERYLALVTNSVENKIGRCDPMARVYDASVVAVCNRFVDPLNGFWAGVFWCCFLFLPTLIVAIKLASLYQKSDPYPGPLVESEYLYDAYSERDHIPLANGPKNKRRKNKDRRRREYYEDTVGVTAHGVPPVATAAAAGVRDTRYSDMAPKHWDGGPPRYQNPPMAPPASEYERPPPYYYPGATEQD